MIRSFQILSFTILLLAFPISTVLAAFQNFTDPTRTIIPADKAHFTDTNWRFDLERTDRYGLPELGVNNVELQRLMKSRDDDATWIIGGRVLSSGDELYLENQATIKVARTSKGLLKSVVVRGGLQSLRIKGYGMKSQPVVGGDVKLRLVGQWIGRVTVEGVALDGGTLSTSVAESVYLFGIERDYDRFGFSSGFVMRSDWEPQVYVNFGGALWNGVRGEVIGFDRPSRVEGAITYELRQFQLRLGFGYQPVIGTTRRMGMSAGW